jgi:hypothetical protein
MPPPSTDREALIAALSEEARSAGGEPPEPEELLAYLEGRLSPEDEQRLGRQLMASPEATSALLDMADFEAAGAAAGSLPSDVAVYAGWRDLERRLPDARPWSRRLPAVLLPGIAAAWLVTTVGLGSWIVKLQGELRRPVPNAPTLDLTSSRADGETIEIPAGAPLRLVLEPPESCPGYEAEVEGPGPGDRETIPGLNEDEQGYLTPVLPRPEPGPYRLRLYGCEPRRELEEHRFRITHDDG